MLFVFGAITIDLITTVPDLPQSGLASFCPAYYLRPGGPAGNMAIAATRAGVAGVQLIGRLGDDEFGKKIAENLRSNGVDITGVASGPQPTGLAQTSVGQGGEYIQSIAMGANAAVRAQQIPTHFMGPNDWLALSLQGDAEQIWEAIRTSRATGCRVMLSYDNPTLAIPPDIFPLINLLVLPYRAAPHLARHAGLTTNDAYDLARDLAANTGGEVVITLDRGGCVAATLQGGWWYEPFTVDVVDRNGTYDAFCGILVANLHNQTTMLDALTAATVGMGLTCLAMGAQDAMPRATILNQWLGDLPKPKRL